MWGYNEICVNYMTYMLMKYLTFITYIQLLNLPHPLMTNQLFLRL